MQNKSAARLQFDLACMRHAYRRRPQPLNRRRQGQILPVPPLLFALVYGTSTAIAIGIIAIGIIALFVFATSH